MRGKSKDLLRAISLFFSYCHRVKRVIPSHLNAYVHDLVVKVLEDANAKTEFRDSNFLVGPVAKDKVQKEEHGDTKESSPLN